MAEETSKPRGGRTLPASALKFEILNILHHDARTSLKEIGSRLGISKRRVARLVEELEKEGVIVGYVARVDWSRAERKMLFAFIEVSVRPERDKGFTAIATRLARFPEVHSLHLVAGEYDLLVVVQGDSIEEIARFVAQKLAPLEGVHRTATHFVLESYKIDGCLLVDTEQEDRRLAISP